MRKEFEDIVRNVCRLTNWKAAPLTEKHGAIGVACILAYLRGVPATPNELAGHIGLSPGEIISPFKRLLVNGMFSSKYDIRNDAALKGEGWFDTTSAWAIIAGIAGGLTGLRETEVAEAA